MRSCADGTSVSPGQTNLPLDGLLAESSLADGFPRLNPGGIMAIFYMRASLVRASSGRSAIAAAAYQSGQSLHSDRLGRSFSYQNKEEVVYSQVLLPANAPSEYADRETLWNAVEASQNRANSRYARQFVIATPVEWSREETIERAREFCERAFVDKGMVCDFAFHDKKGNPHIHVMCSVRGFNPDGTWAAMEKKAFALDEHGERIPEIDPTTGEQKVRRRNRGGHISVEKLWKRITVQANDWNRRQFLMDTKKAWAEYANRFLVAESQIDHRTYEERGITDHVPMLHEGPDSRAALRRGATSSVIKENRIRAQINRVFDELRSFVLRFREHLNDYQTKILNRGAAHDHNRSIHEDRPTERNDTAYPGLPFAIRGSDQSAPGIGSELIHPEQAHEGERIGDRDLEEHHNRIQSLRERLQEAAKRNRSITESVGDAGKRKQALQDAVANAVRIKRLRQQTEKTAERIRRHNHKL